MRQHLRWFVHAFLHRVRLTPVILVGSVSVQERKHLLIERDWIIPVRHMRRIWNGHSPRMPHRIQERIDRPLEYLWRLLPGYHERGRLDRLSVLPGYRGTPIPHQVKHRPRIVAEDLLLVFLEMSSASICREGVDDGCKTLVGVSLLMCSVAATISGASARGRSAGGFGGSKPLSNGPAGSISTRARIKSAAPKAGGRRTRHGGGAAECRNRARKAMS